MHRGPLWANTNFACNSFQKENTLGVWRLLRYISQLKIITKAEWSNSLTIKKNNNSRKGSQGLYEDIENKSCHKSVTSLSKAGSSPLIRKHWNLVVRGCRWTCTSSPHGTGGAWQWHRCPASKETAPDHALKKWLLASSNQPTKLDYVLSSAPQQACLPVVVLLWLGFYLDLSNPVSSQTIWIEIFILETLVLC
jgi:hypothetical protein